MQMIVPGLVKKKRKAKVTVWMPEEMVAHLEALALEDDTDRSKVILALLEEALASLGSRKSKA